MSSESASARRERLLKVVEILKREYPDAKCTLDFRTPHELLVAAILAAQCTDERVNEVTPELFRKYPSVSAFAAADRAELEEMVKPTGFFRNKTRAIIESARQIVTDFGGRVPDTIEELTGLSGVGRKTANLIVGVAYGKPAVIVDTHVKRVTTRLGFTDQTDPDKIEQDLRAVLPPEESTLFNHLIVAHGRTVCKAPTPLCDRCVVVELCPYGLERVPRKLYV